MAVHYITSPILFICIGIFLIGAAGQVFNNKFIIQLQKIDDEVAEKLHSVDQMVNILDDKEVFILTMSTVYFTVTLS